MKKVIILGADGMIGHMITLYLSELKKYEIYDFCNTRKIRKKSYLIDIKNLEYLYEQINDSNPDIIINCIELVNHECDQDPMLASYINSFLPHYLVNKYKDTECKIIHLSTDCVFDGKKGSYEEDDDKTAGCIYGITKGLGEFNNNKDLTIRVSVIGPDIKDNDGLFNWFMKQEDAIDGYQDVWWNGLTNLELAKIIDIAIEKNVLGLYNVSSNQKINNLNLLNIMKNVFKKESINVYAETKNKLDRSLLSKRRDLNYEIKSYDEIIKELYDWMMKHPKYYQRYFSLKDKVIIVWSKIKLEPISEEKRGDWIKHRISVFMNYTLKSFQNQTNKDFYYFINYDEYAKPYIIQELKKYPQLPDNIVFTEHYYNNIERIIPFYKDLYLVRIDSDDMFQKDFMHKLNEYKPKKDTKVLIVENGYIYDALTDELARWVYKAPYFSPFYTLIYNCFDFSNGFRHDTHGDLSVFKTSCEVIYGDNFIVIVHHQNTATVFHCSFRKQIVDRVEKEKIKKENNLIPMKEE